MEDPGAELDGVVRSLLAPTALAPTADDYGRMSSQISFRMTAPCDMLRKEENLALTARTYSQYRLECALSGIEAPDEPTWRKMHAGWFDRPVEWIAREEPEQQIAWQNMVQRCGASEGTCDAG